MTNATAIRAIAVHLPWGNSHAAAELMRIATRIQALEAMLGEIVDSDRAQTLATYQATQSGVVVQFRARGVAA